MVFGKAVINEPMSRMHSYCKQGILVLSMGFALMACNSSSDPGKDNKDTGQAIIDSPSNEANTPPALHAEAILSATYTDTIVNGKAVFDAANGKVKMTIVLTVPAKANKTVAVHIHEHGDCGENGNMAHGHWNPGNTQHGKWGSDSFHAGDIGNVKLNEKGEGSLTMETDLWSLGGDSTKNIMGRGLIVHGGTDDYKTQPTGNAGSRIGCGVIR